ncbi:MAG: hypothetical protein AAF770_02175 [Bacteroidota bacterium]
MIRGLIRLLEKVDKDLDQLEDQYEFEDKETYQKQRIVIKKALQ